MDNRIWITRVLIMTVLLLFSSALWAGTVDLALNQPLDELRAEADQAYDMEEYRKAKKKYSTLAKMGSKYAQYKLSLMYHQGQGVDVDPVEAYAWAALAAEFEPEVLVQHRDAIWNTVPSSSRQEAREAAAKRLEKMNDRAITKMLMHQSRLRLTMERLGRGLLNESQVSVQAPCDLPGFAQGDLGNVSANSAGGFVTGPCSGIQSTIHDNPLVRLEMLKMINYTMDQRLQGENVELGEFEVLEDDS